MKTEVRSIAIKMSVFLLMSICILGTFNDSAIFAKDSLDVTFTTSKDGDGTLPREERAAAAKERRQNRPVPKPVDPEKLFSEFDKDKDGKLSKEEGLALIKHLTTRRRGQRAGNRGQRAGNESRRDGDRGQPFSAQITDFIWSGSLSDTSAKVASRIKSAGTEVRLRVSTSADLSNPVYSAYKTADSGVDNMVHLYISGLTEDTQYYYAIEDRNGNIDDRIGKFQTIKMGAYSFTFAAASCARTGSDHFVFDNIASKPIKFFMNTGDLHYRDITVNNVSLYATGYKALFNSARQRNLYQNNSFAYIWDDHDFGPNGSWGGSPGKPAAQLAYRRYVPSHDLVLPKAGNGIYRAFSVGRVRFVITDLRSYSDKGGDALAPGRTLMGSAQKAWFKQELLNSRDTHKLIVWVSTVPWIGSPQSGKDRWYGFCAEREELANFFRDNDLDKRMCIIAGDAHTIAADDGRNNTYGGDGSPMFPVFHAAALDRPGSTKGGPYSEGTYAGYSRYGLFKVTDNGGDTVTFNFKGIKATSSTAGNVLIDYTFDSPKAPPKR